MGLVIHYDYLTKTNIKTYISNKILSKGIVYCLLPQHIEHDHHCPDTSVSGPVSFSPVVVHVRPFPWRPGGQGPQTKPAETWALSKH